MNIKSQESGQMFAVDAVAPSNEVVSVDIKVFLQGPLASGNTMNNFIQTGTHGFSAPALPTTNPYGIAGATYDQINNTSGTAGLVVDWVKVEMRSAANPATILEARALLLKPDGHIVDTNGLEPKFNAQSTPARIAVFHRNHLSVMSSGVVDLSAKLVSCDFRSSLSNAYKVNPGDPAPMVQQDGVWCMWAGDVNMDGFIDNSDLALVNAASSSNVSNSYAAADLNLDGAVDSADMTLATANFNSSVYSPVIFFP